MFSETEKETTKSFSWKNELKEFISAAIWAVILAFIIKTFIFQLTYVPTGSMIPTILPNDRVVVLKFWYKIKPIERGQIVVFDPPNSANSPPFIKRVIGLPGETLEIKNNTVYINGKPLKENYLPAKMEMEPFGPFKIPKDAIFVMGDNRQHSADSRYFGAVPIKNIKGRAVLTYWPLNRVKVLR
ncbi:signal peptidase I [Carboxydothermus ferrireducens]|uniref:Signal peptidase I n=1 Tax=Carboxydothermus ferrireducens DSM 11255 TaxID=1119529 RepID=A0ABX2RAC2_9THEO|nr:signal peptidase I [Carboxydothermus ferrireducens]NYE58126.1 signal peptidase I [Carboxydothermus ferrireducens DSM 11255]